MKKCKNFIFFKKKLLILVGLIFVINLFAELDFLTIKENYYNSYNNETNKNYAAAIKDLENIYKNHPDFYTVNYRLGWLYYLKGNFANSILHLEKSLQVYPNSIEVLNTITAVYAAKLDWSKVEKMAKKTIEINYYDLTANFWYSQALSNQKKFEEAIVANRVMLAVYPTSITFLREIAINLFLNENFDESQKYFESVIILNPDDDTAQDYQNKILSQKK